MLVEELTRGDVMYLLHVSANMIEMCKRKRGEATYVRLLAHTLRGLCKKLVYGEKRVNYLGLNPYSNALVVPSLN